MADFAHSATYQEHVGVTDNRGTADKTSLKRKTPKCARCNRSLLSRFNVAFRSMHEPGRSDHYQFAGENLASGLNIDARTNSPAVRDLYDSVEGFIEDSMIYRKVD